jgi:hypothetical protein
LEVPIPRSTDCGGAPGRGVARTEVPGHHYDEVAALVAGRVEETLGKLSAKRLLPVSRAAGDGGSPRNSAGWSRRRSRRGVVIITADAGRGMGAG